MDKVHRGLALEIHPRKAQKDRKSKHKEKGHIWVSKKSLFISSLLYASSSLLRDSRELTYYWVEHPIPEARPAFPSFMGKHIFYSILEIPIQSLFSSLCLSHFCPPCSSPLALPIHTFCYLRWTLQQIQRYQGPAKKWPGLKYFSQEAKLLQEVMMTYPSLLSK